ncbi:17576_t:CDS:2, partial [Funneliformis geosporum]
SLTSDIWTSTLTIEAFLVRNTEINIAEYIIIILNEFELMNKTLGLTTDNESAIVVCDREIANQIHAKQGLKLIDKENLTRDMETEWNSTYYMLQRFKQMETVLHLLEIEYPVIRNLLSDTEGWLKIWNH